MTMASISKGWWAVSSRKAVRRKPNAAVPVEIGRRKSVTNVKKNVAPGAMGRRYSGIVLER
ncbi:MAG: hypothetical protein IIB59_05475 [Planctomycetes bacterium]|nr:hypothetical protein [Planctomycetota bacterium]